MNQLNDVCDEDEGVRKLLQRRRKHFTLSLPFFSLDASFFCFVRSKMKTKKQKEPTHQLARLKKREARSLDEEKTNTHATAGWWSRLEALSFRNDEPHRLNLINRRSFGREGATFTDESRTKRPRRNTKHINFRFVDARG